MIDLITALTFQQKQIVVYGLVGLVGVLSIIFVVILIMKILAVRSEKKSEILPSLSELGIESEEEAKEDSHPFNFDDEDDDISAFFDNDDDNNVNSDSFLDK